MTHYYRNVFATLTLIQSFTWQTLGTLIIQNWAVGWEKWPTRSKNMGQGQKWTLLFRQAPKTMGTESRNRTGLLPTKSKSEDSACSMQRAYSWISKLWKRKWQHSSNTGTHRKSGLPSPRLPDHVTEKSQPETPESSTAWSTRKEDYCLITIPCLLVLAFKICQLCKLHCAVIYWYENYHKWYFVEFHV